MELCPTVDKAHCYFDCWAFSFVCQKVFGKSIYKIARISLFIINSIDRRPFTVTFQVLALMKKPEK